MPYVVRQDGDKWCVFNSETDDKKACHDTQEEADKQVRLLNGLEHGMEPHSGS